MPQITEQVAKNRESTRRLDGRFVDLPETANRNLSFARNTIEVAVTIEIYKRGLNDALISGHPNAAHGSGRGVAGDVRGSWTSVSTTTQSALFVRSGRNAVRDALNGQSGAVREAEVGTDATAAAVGDSALGAETGSTLAYGVKDSGTVTRARAQFLFAEDGLESSDAVEFGLKDETGRLLARVTTDAVDVTEEEELRVDISLEVSGSGTGNSVITTDGEAAIADSLRAVGDTVGLNELRFGTGSTTPSKSDSALASEEYAQLVLRNLSNESIEVEGVTDSSEPPGQPVDLTEVGVFDNSSTPRLVWRTTMSTLEKTDAFGFRTTVGFRIV